MASKRHRNRPSGRAQTRPRESAERRAAPATKSAAAGTVCPRCGDPISPSPSGRGRPRRWCSQRCRRAAYEERRAAANGAIATEIVVQQVEPPWAATLERVLESPVACRKVVRDLRQRLNAGELNQPPWDNVAAEVWALSAAVQQAAVNGSSRS